MQLLLLLLRRVTLQAHQIQLALRTCRLRRSLHPLLPLLNRLWRPNNLHKVFKRLHVLQAWLEQLEAFPRRSRQANKACKVKLLVWAFRQFLRRPDQLLSPKVGQTLLFLLLCRPFLRRVVFGRSFALERRVWAVLRYAIATAVIDHACPAAVVRVAPRLFASSSEAGDPDCRKQVRRVQ